MRKKSHILLARYLADQMTVSESLQSHRKAFCLGNILPDIRPSFVTKRHEFFGTFDEIQEKLKTLVEDGVDQYRERVFWRRLGEIFHYIADYFTFPHNKTFTGSLVEHNSYEKELKNRLKTCIRNGEAARYQAAEISFGSFGQLTEYIREKHAEYLKNGIFQMISGIFLMCAVRCSGECAGCVRDWSRKKFLYVFSEI